MKKGRPDLEAEIDINLTVFRDGVAGTWFTTEVTHTIDRSGYTTSVRGRFPG